MEHAGGGDHEGLAAQAETVDLRAIRDAAERLRGVAVRTPLLEDFALGAKLGTRVLIKPECLQRTGAFKLRGAYNRLSRLDERERSAGVVAWSSGNHAQAVAAAARLLGIEAAIVMPRDAPRIKIDGTRAHGAEVILYDRETESREEIGADVARRRGAVIVPPFDDPHIIAGQGTAGLEIVEQAETLGVEIGSVAMPCSGGGLAAGVATAVKSLRPAARVYAVEPEGFDDHARSLASGRRERNTPGEHSICDGLQVPEPGALTFPINRRLLAGGLTVSDAEVATAMRHAFEALKLVVEPSGAAALAALLAGKLDPKGEPVCVILSGGNVDRELFARIVSGP